MKRTISLLLMVLAAMLAAGVIAFAQLQQYKGDAINRYENHHTGNKIGTIFYNYGLVANVNEQSCEWPLGTGNEYVGDVTPLVGLEFVHPNGDTLHSIITCSSPRQSPEYVQGLFSGFEPLPGFAGPPLPGETGQVAMSNLPLTWPSFWPDKMYTDANDQSWRRDENDPGWPGSWNGYFGKDVVNADQESYFQMDDNADIEWFERPDSAGNPIYLYPDATDSSRRGLGIRVSVRGLQWAHFLAEDCIFWLYEITNVGTTYYDKVCFGMVVGTLAGGRQDSEDDLAFFDPQNDITYSWDGTPGPIPGWTWVRPGEIQVGYSGYAFLESPGNPYDGIDNDGDSPNPSPVLTLPILSAMIQPMSYGIGQELVTIDYETYARTVVTMPDTLFYTIRGVQKILLAGQYVLEDPHNGLDDNFNGLIDERLGEEFQGKRLDHLGLKYKDYFTGAGVGDLMIDEARDDELDNDGDWDPLADDVGFDGVAGTADFGEGDALPSYGEPNFDRTDVDESDQIGLTAFDYFSPPGAVRMNDDEGIWARMAPGYIDLVSLNPEDGDFIYGSGYFPLPPGKTERFSMALLFGEDSLDITENKLTVQQIYDNNYNFAKPPDKATVTAVPGDGQVTLYWDDLAEFSYDPANEGDEHDFEGYKIYRATDPGFLESLTITDGLGRLLFNEPIAQFDLANGNSGFFPISIYGASFYLGGDTGLTHVWTDTTVENGQRYYYAVCAYDHGNVNLGFFPAETSKYIFVDEGGNIATDINTCWVVPRAPAAGYVAPEISPAQHVSGNASGLVYVEMVDPDLINSNMQYTVVFVGDSLGQATSFGVLAVTNGDTSMVLDNQSLANTQDDQAVLSLFNSYFDSLFGLYPGTYDAFQYFTTVQSNVFDGQRLYLIKPRFPGQPVWEFSGWNYPDSLLNFGFNLINYPSVYLIGLPWSADYQAVFYDDFVDTAIAYTWYSLSFPETPVHFRIKNLSSGEYPAMVFDEDNGNGIAEAGEAILIFEGQPDTLIPTYAINFSSSLEQGHIYVPSAGDTLTIHMYKAFAEEDRYSYGTTAALVNPNLVNLNAIKVYPNPYLGANTQEPSNPYSAGRGERRITFIHLPSACTIRIYTVRGELVDIIEHFTTINDGMANWDLRTKDGLDAAYGVYIYHVNSTFGEQIGKFAVIK